MVSFSLYWHKLKRRKKLPLALSAVATFSLAIIFLVHSFNSPAVGTINSVLSSRTENSPMAQKPSEQYDGKYVSFSYPAQYKPAESNLSGNFLEVYRLYDNGLSSRSITVGVMRETLENDSGLNFRRNHPDIYQSQTSPAGSAIFVSHQNGFERTVYISHGGLVLSLSALDPAGRDMSGVEEDIINSLKWK